MNPALIRFAPILIVALVLVSPGIGDEKRDALVKKVDAMMDGAMKGYNDNDAVKFHADFLKKLRERDDLKDHFALFFHDDNKEKYGKYVSRKLLEKDCVFEDDLIVMHYQAVFEKNKKVKIMAALGKEEGAPRFKLIDITEDK
jgi:hypothetical protein